MPKSRSGRALKQTELQFQSGWGGRRPGAGRKPSPDSGVPHLRRDAVASRFPLHVTARLRAGLPGLRRASERSALEDAFGAARERDGFRLVHYSIQWNHLHLIVEGRDRIAVARGLQGLLIRVSRALNALWGRLGPVFADRYHARILRTPREVRATLVYVLQNARGHGARLPGLDPFSSAAWLDGWREPVRTKFARLFGRTVSEPRTWLLKEGWRRHGLIGVTEVPSGSAHRLGSQS